MTDAFSPPNKFQIEKARELYSDPVLYYCTNLAVQTLNNFEVDPKANKKHFYKEARLMLLNYPLIEVLGIIMNASEDLNEEDYSKFNLPSLQELKRPKRDYKVPKHLKSIQITKIADEYGLQPLGSNLRICPFHKDKSPSLSLSDEKYCFHCFGCKTSGGIRTFVGMLESIKQYEEEK